MNEALQRDLRRLHMYVDSKYAIAVDTETTSLHVGDPNAVTIGVSVSFFGPAKVSLYVPFHHEVGENADEATQEMLRWVLEHWSGPMVFANVVFDVLALEALDIQVEDRDLWDVIVMAHLLNENEPRSKGLESLAQHYVSRDLEKLSTPGLEKEKKTGWKNTAWEDIAPYAIRDTDLTLQVYFTLDHLLEGKKEVPEGIWDLKRRFFRTLIAMRRYGVKIDTELAQQHVAEANTHMQVSKALLKIPEKQPLGPKALEWLIHGELAIPVLHKTDTGKPSFDKAAMADYERLLEAQESPVASALKTYRGWQKASTAASIPYLALMDSDGRLRCSYKMHGTVTGRLSCEQPNLQQIPKASDKPWNGRLKEQFIAEEGYTLINADFSQLELRLATAYAGEPSLVKVFEEGRDIFTEMSETLGWSRNDTKTFVYSVQYGAGVGRIMQAFNVSKRQAEQMITNYRRTYQRFARTADIVQREAESKLRIRLWSGRWRRFQYASEGYKAWNSLIQGGGADIVERCLVRCFETLHNDDCRMLLQVHDSITWEVRSDLVAEMMPKIKATMEDVRDYCGKDFGVKFAVDVDYWSPREAAKHAEVRAVA